MVLDGTVNYQATLTKDHLFGWHEALEISILNLFTI